MNRGSGVRPRTRIVRMRKLVKRFVVAAGVPWYGPFANPDGSVGRPLRRSASTAAEDEVAAPVFAGFREVVAVVRAAGLLAGEGGLGHEP